MSNSVDPDEMAHYGPSHLVLRSLQKPMLSPVAVKELTRLYEVNISLLSLQEIMHTYKPHLILFISNTDNSNCCLNQSI